METAAVKPTVIVIPANPDALKHQADPYHQKRVAAYCRVSTDEDDQINSYEAQCRFFQDRISNNKEWKLAGIFADEGITGTSAKKRPNFQKMIRQCEKGKIDMILTKSISRFARNTVDSLQYVRKLKAMGIAVVFEKEGIDTSTMNDEMILTVMSMFAQAESESISKNVADGQRYSFREGKVRYCYPIYGYLKGEDKKPVIFEEQAVHVREIYDMFLGGSSILQIRDYLNGMNVPTARGGGRWSTAIIQGILCNEKYVGDALLQKTYISDVISRKVMQNNGVLPKYLVRDCHPAIVDRATFTAVQEELARRSSKKKISFEEADQRGKHSGKYALTDLMVCEECGSSYRRRTWCRKNGKQFVWRCNSRCEHGTKYCKESPTIPEPALHEAILRVINRKMGDASGMLPLLKKNLRIALSGESSESNVYALEAKIKDLKDTMMQLVDLSVRSGADSSRYDKEFDRIGAEIAQLNELLEAEKRIDSARAESCERTDEIIDKICAGGFALTEFDNTTIRKLIECVKVTTRRTLKIYFIGGYMVEEPVADGL